MSNPDAARVILCGYPASDAPDSGSIPMVLVRKQAAQAVFAAIWLIGDQINQVELKRLPDHDGKRVYQVTCDGKIRRHNLRALTK